MTLGRFCTTIFALTMAAATAFAEEGGRQGIAFVQAPEMSSGVCTGKDAASAFDCAKKQCIDGGGTAEDCLEQAYCFPARFSVDVFMQSSEGPHWHEYFCGWESKELALAAAKVACDNVKRPDLIECTAVLTYDEDGTSEEVPMDN